MGFGSVRTAFEFETQCPILPRSHTSPGRRDSRPAATSSRRTKSSRVRDGRRVYYLPYADVPWGSTRSWAPPPCPSTTKPSLPRLAARRRLTASSRTCTRRHRHGVGRIGPGTSRGSTIWDSQAYGVVLRPSTSATEPKDITEGYTEADWPPRMDDCAGIGISHGI